MEEDKADISALVPKAIFIEDVAGFVGDRPIEQVLSEVEINLQRYQYAEQEVSKRRQRLLMKEPELKQCLDAIDMLVQQRDAGVDTTTLDFALSDQVYARAKVSGATNTVGIWLGANVMVEYELEEAKELLERQLEACWEQLQAAQRDYDYVKDQLTITQVSLSRCYNFNIGRKSEAR